MFQDMVFGFFINLCSSVSSSNMLSVLALALSSASTDSIYF